jgi:hypothetical protein
MHSFCSRIFWKEIPQKYKICIVENLFSPLFEMEKDLLWLCRLTPVFQNAGLYSRFLHFESSDFSPSPFQEILYLVVPRKYIFFKKSGYTLCMCQFVNFFNIFIFHFSLGKIWCFPHFPLCFQQQIKFLSTFSTGFSTGIF